MIVQDVISREVKGVWGNPPQEGATLTPVIKTNNMSYEGYISFDDLTYRDIPVKKLHTSFLQKGDLLIEKSGGTKTHSVGYVNIFENENDTYVCNNFIFAIRPDVNIILPKYLFFQLKYMYETGQFSDCYNKTTGIQNLKTDRYLAKSIKCPTKSDQQKIISALDNIEQGIKVKEEQLKALDELIQSRFTEMFGTLDMSKASDDWQSLGLLAKIHTGTTPSTTNADNWNGDILWITPAEIKSDSYYIYDTTRKITKQGQLSKSLTIMPRDTVLLSTRAPIGKVGIVGKPMACNQGFKNFECGKKLNPIFLYVLLKYNTTYLNSLGTGTTFKEISKSNVEKIKIPVPCVEKQNQFAEFIRKVEKAKEIVKIQIKDLQELLALKMDEYFK